MIGLKHVKELVMPELNFHQDYWLDLENLWKTE